MGRMNEPTTEAWAGGSAAAVNQAWMQHDRSRARRSTDRFRAIEAWVTSRPELCIDGEPCPFAHYVTASIRDRFIDQEALAAAVVVGRANYLRGRWGDAEAEAYLAGSDA